jgi:hypothetical protein
VTTFSVQAPSPLDQDPNTSISFTQHTLAEACSRLGSACSDFILRSLLHELPDATYPFMLVAMASRHYAIWEFGTR